MYQHIMTYVDVKSSTVEHCNNCTKNYVKGAESQLPNLYGYLYVKMGDRRVCPPQALIRIAIGS